MSKTIKLMFLVGGDSKKIVSQMMLSATEEEIKQGKGYSTVEWMERVAILNHVASFTGKTSLKCGI